MGTIIPTFPGWQQGDTVVVHRIFLPGPPQKRPVGEMVTAASAGKKMPLSFHRFCGFCYVTSFPRKIPPSFFTVGQATTAGPPPSFPQASKMSAFGWRRVHQSRKKGPMHSATFICEYCIEHTADRQLGWREEGRKGCSVGAIVAVACWPMLGCSPEVQLHRNGLLLLRLLDKAPQRRMGALSYVFTYDCRSLPVSKYF